MKIGNLEIRGDLVLAPMAGVTDLAFRTICAELGAAVTVTEMVSSRALIYQDKKSRLLLHRTPIGVCGAQIFGNDPSVMAEGAALALEASGADFIDINMGCPMPKIVNNGDGSALCQGSFGIQQDGPALPAAHPFRWRGLFSGRAVPSVIAAAFQRPPSWPARAVVAVRPAVAALSPCNTMTGPANGAFALRCRRPCAAMTGGLGRWRCHPGGSP